MEFKRRWEWGKARMRIFGKIYCRVQCRRGSWLERLQLLPDFLDLIYSQLLVGDQLFELMVA